MLSLATTILFVAIATYILYLRWLRSKYPPGPWPLPIIGNLFLLSAAPHLDFIKLSKKYGPVFTLWMGRQPTVIVNNLNMIKIATMQKGLEFAGRAMDSTAYKILLSENQDLLAQSYNHVVEVMRKLCSSIMKSKSIGGMSIQKIVEEETEFLLQSIKEMEGNLVDPRIIINVPASNTIMRSILNFRFENHKDKNFLYWEQISWDMQMALEKAVFLNFFPMLWYVFPGMRQSIIKGGMQYDDFVEKHLKHHEDTYQKGIIRDLTDEVLKYQKTTMEEQSSCQVFTRTNVAGVVKDMLGAGTQTSIANANWCFLFLIRYPEIQQKMFQELQNFLEKQTKCERGLGTMLVFTAADRPYLPYTNSFVHEVFRRCSATPLSLPHKTLADVYLGKYLIPNNTAIMLNNHGSNMDNSVWKTPYTFAPERFLDENGDFIHAKAKQLMSFGAGPRSCIGENLAKMESFTFVANIVYSFELSCPSVEELPSLDNVRYRLECSPMPFKVVFNSRTKKASHATQITT